MKIRSGDESAHPIKKSLPSLTNCGEYIVVYTVITSSQGLGFVDPDLVE